MKCEYCDSMIKTVPDNGICPNCCAPLPVQEKSSKRKFVFPDPPMGIFEGTSGDYWEIDEHSVRFHINNFFVVENRIIKFNEITDVKYVPGSFWRGSGFVCIRERKEAWRAMPVNTDDARDDNGSLIFYYTDNERFYKLFHFLQQCAEIVNETYN